ncbi:actin-related protein 8, partial [Phenoliferia sp. Uapishka_3]
MPSKPKTAQSAGPAVASVPIKFTTFQVIGFLNGKNVASNFVKSDSQNWWSRREPEDEWDKARDGKRRKLLADEDELVQAVNDGVELHCLTAAPPGLVRPPHPPKEATEAQDGPVDPTTKTIVIHPGSRWLRIGRASDAFPLSVPNVIASRTGAPPSSKGKGVDRSQPPPTSAPVHNANPLHVKLPPFPSASTSKARAPRDNDGDDDMLDSDDNSDDDDDEEDAVDPLAPVDPIAAKISSIRGDLRARMRVFKLRGQGNGNSQAAAYNATVTPEPTPDYNDPNEVTWMDVKGPDAKPFYVGNEALTIPDAEEAGYTIRRPYDRGVFNTKDYLSSQELLGDVERIWLTTLEQELGITKEELKDYSAILIIPDLYDHVYIREMTDLVLKWIGFKQLCLQQESICATFGAGLSTACVIDIGAKKTSITCIEEGLILPETRMVLDFAGDDITEFLHTLLIRTNFPYREADLTRWHDFTLLEELKERMVVLSEGDVGLNIYDFYVRSPHKSTVKYMLRCYDDVILAPYVRLTCMTFPEDRAFNVSTSTRLSSHLELSSLTRRSHRHKTTYGRKMSKI